MLQGVPDPAKMTENDFVCFSFTPKSSAISRLRLIALKPNCFCNAFRVRSVLLGFGVCLIARPQFGHSYNAINSLKVGSQHGGCGCGVAVFTHYPASLYAKF